MGSVTYTQVVVWGPKTGCELNFDDDPRSATIETRAAALRGLRLTLPGARVAAFLIAPQTRAEGERLAPGYLVLLLIAIPAGVAASYSARRLRNWVESEVSVALLELISPVNVDWVGVAPEAERHPRRSGGMAR